MTAPTRSRLTDHCWRCDDHAPCRPVATTRRPGRHAVTAWYRCPLGHVWRAEWSGFLVNDDDLAAALPERPYATPSNWPEYLIDGRAVVLACDACHASAGQIATTGHIGACNWPGRHNHPVSLGVQRCGYWLDHLQDEYDRRNHAQLSA